MFQPFLMRLSYLYMKTQTEIMKTDNLHVGILLEDWSDELISWLIGIIKKTDDYWFYIEKGWVLIFQNQPLKRAWKVTYLYLFTFLELYGSKFRSRYA